MLAEIADDVRNRLQSRSRQEWEREIEARMAHAKPVTRFRDAINGPGDRFIFEIKRTSPSSTTEPIDINVTERARLYELSGASAISVLTEPNYFGGTLADLESVRHAVTLPILRKDFIIDRLQIAEAKAYGASAVLLIVALLSEVQLREFIKHAEAHQLDALVEIHTEDELHRALDCGASIIGVNNRNLKTLEIDLECGANLLTQVPDNCICVAESGLKTNADIEIMRRAGANAFLIGTSIMHAPDPQTKIAELMRR